MSHKQLLPGVAGALLMMCASSSAQMQFVEVGAEHGFRPYHMATGLGGSAAAADFDDDGDVDIFVPTGYGMRDQLYRNLGDGRCEEIAAAAGVASVAGGRGALWLDFDGDHRLDLFVGTDTLAQDGEPLDVPRLRLYRQVADAQFEEMSAAAGLSDPGGGFRSGTCAGDLNNDGYVDLVTTSWGGGVGLARVFMNRGDGTFEDVSEDSGIGADTGWHWQSMMHDFNGDGWLDVYIAMDFTPNLLWINQGDGTFVDEAPGYGLDNTWNDMGMTIGDYDNDGDFDVYVTNITNGWIDRQSIRPGHRAPVIQEVTRHNVLFRNDGPTGFVEVAKDTRTFNGGFGWGTTLFDADNDGWLDLAATNGMNTPHYSNDRTRLFLNRGIEPARFGNIARDVGLDDSEWGSSLIAFDADRDGDLDLVQTCNLGGPLRMLENHPDPIAAAHHWLELKPRMDGPNHRALGAVIRLVAGDSSMARLITAGTSFMGQEPAEAHFGLGAESVASSVTVEWPDGAATTWTNVPVDRVITLVPGGRPADLDMNAVVGPGDIAVMAAAWGPCPPPPAVCGADLDGSGHVGMADLLGLLAAWD